MAEDENDDSPEKPEFHLQERFVWKWHPHGWLTAILVVLLILLLINFAF